MTGGAGSPAYRTGSPAYRTGSVTSCDGTTIGYRQLGHGPGLIAVHGGMQAAQNLMKLAVALADSFTVYLPDRRGRGLSGPPGSHYSLAAECQDIDALAQATGTQRTELAGCGHLAPDNNGEPARVARELRPFFAS